MTGSLFSGRMRDVFNPMTSGALLMMPPLVVAGFVLERRLALRTKILLASSFEEAWDFFSAYQDIVLGIYYLTTENDGEPGEGMAFADIDEVYNFAWFQYAVVSGVFRF